MAAAVASASVMLLLLLIEIDVLQTQHTKIVKIIVDSFITFDTLSLPIQSESS